MPPKNPSCGHINVTSYVHLGEGRGVICSVCHEHQSRLQYNPKVLRRERQPLRVGRTTLVGVMGFADPDGNCTKCGHDHVADPHCIRKGDGVTATCAVDDCGGSIPTKDPFPIPHGNCCSVINMSTENVREALKRWPGLAVDCEVEIVELNGREMTRVIDDRLPTEWKKHKCSTCGFYEDGSPPPDLPAQPDPDAPPGEGQSEISEIEQGFVYAPYIPVLLPHDLDADETEL